MSADHANDADTDLPEPTADRGEDVAVPGAVVVDADADPETRDPAVVVNTPPVAAREWTAYTDRDGAEVSVADDNPEHDPEAEVVVVVYRADLERAHPEYEGDRPLPLAEVDPKTYAFPPRRLQRVGRLSEGDDTDDVDDAGRAGDATDAADDSADAGDERDPSDRLTDAQRDLRERLAETSDVEVAADPDDPEAAVLVVEKLGREHTIDADGAVEGGPLADRLGDIAAEYLGGEPS